MSSTTHNITPGRYERQLPVATKVHTLSSAATTNPTLVKNSPGAIFNLIIHNTHSGGGSGSSIAFRMYDLSVAPTVGTSVPMIIIHVPSNSSKELNFTSGITFVNGIAYSITDGDSLLDATAISADGVQVYMGYM